MATIPTWLIGRDVTNLTLYGLTANTSTGVLGVATGATAQFYGHIQEVELITSKSFENISAMDRPFSNNVAYETGTILRITELENRGTGTTANLAAWLGFGYDYASYVLVRGAQTFSGYGAIGEYQFSGTKPKITARLELQMIDPGTGTANPSYA